MEENFKLPELPIIGPKRPDEKSTEEKKQDKYEEFSCPYKVPKYSGPVSSKNYSFEVLKNGVIVEEIKDLQKKPYHVFGRLPIPHVDINSLHPTTSRFHCVLQYRPAIIDDESNDENVVEEGWYIYDLDSTHGTFLNKMRVKPKIYVRVRVGHQIKLGNSTRCYILQGPSEDEEEQSEFTVTELKQMRLEKEMERQQKELEEKLEKERIEKEKEEEGINWGMGDDAEEELDLTENPFAATNNEEIFINDPKKTLRGFFEREGHELDYRCDELSPGVFICRVELPIDDEFGKPLICEVQHKGKKKECVVQCALEACRILDRHGVLRQANHEPRRKRKVSESDSDDDNFFDRTGDVEKKKMKKQGQPAKEALTYEQLQVQEEEILTKIKIQEKKLEEMIENEKRLKQQNQMEDDDIDSFMSHLTDQKVDKFEIRNMKNELQNLKLEHLKIQKLINIAKPSVVLPSITQPKGKLPLFGKRNRLPRNFGLKCSTEANSSKKEIKEFEVEEDDEELDGSEKKNEDSKTKEVENSKEISKPVTIAPEKPKSPTEAQKKLETKPEEPKKVETTQTSNVDNDTLSKSEEEKVIKEPKETKKDDKISSETTQQPPLKKTKKPQKLYKTHDRYRANIDMNDDDEYIDEEKVSMWLPPENQSGDGSSHLNDKFGY